MEGLDLPSPPLAPSPAALVGLPKLRPFEVMTGHSANRKAAVRKAFLLSQDETTLIIAALEGHLVEEWAEKEARDELIEELRERWWA